MSAVFRVSGDNGIVQIDRDFVNLALVKVGTATPVANRYPNAGNAFEYSDYDTDAVNRLYAFKTSAGGFVRFLRTPNWYNWVAPPNVPPGQHLWFDSSDVGEQTITVYVFDYPKNVVPSGPLIRLSRDDGVVSFDSRQRYMNVARPFSGTLTAFNQVAVETLPTGDYAVCPLTEAHRWSVISCWDNGGVRFCDYNDAVSWWKTTNTSVEAKLVTAITEAPSNITMPSNAVANALIIRVG